MGREVWVFLDVDGVLNCDRTKNRTPNGFTGLDEEKLCRLAAFVHGIGARVALTSTWKDSSLWWREKNPGADLVYLLNRLSAHGVDVEVCSPEGDRGEAVRGFLEKHPGRAIIFDDQWKSSFADAGVARYLVQTSPREGLQDKHIRRAMKLLAWQEEKRGEGK